MMHTIFSSWKNMGLALCLIFLFNLNAMAADQGTIPLKTMGSPFFGGTVTKAENGETFHGDHG